MTNYLICATLKDMTKLKEDNKIIIKHFRVTEEGNKKLERLASDSGFASVSDYIRFTLGLNEK